MSAQLLEDLERDESYRAAPYKCPSDFWTLGIGQNLEANPLTGQQWKQLLDAKMLALSISPAGAKFLLAQAVQNVEAQCAITFKWWRALDEVRRDALVNLCFNIGMTRLLGFRRMLEAFNARNFEHAADELLNSRYAKQVGARARRLAHMIRTGVRP